ncbi:MAG: minor capsid protein, partial [Anaerococcus sp.]
LDTDLRQGLITGKSPGKITEVIADRLEVSKSNAKRLVMTESAAIHSGSKKIMYDRLGVKKYKIVATLDLRTSEICRDMDGKVFDAKDYEVGITAPPFHVYCRSTTVPYFEDDLQKEIEDTRMSRNLVTGKSERVPDMNYENWYNKYAVAYNDEKEFNNIVSILGTDMVGNLEKYKDIKYNNVEKYEQINRETNTIQMINNHSSFSEKFKEKVKNMYYEFRNHGYEFNMHGAERFIKHSNIGKYTEKEVLEVLNKDFNMRQISDDRPVKFYNNIQVIY